MLRRTARESAQRQPLWLLRRSDQAVVGSVALLALAALGAYLYWPRDPDKELVELEHFPVRPLKFQTDLNRADWPELAGLPGIGETLARRIVEHRNRHGPFRRAEDLRQVRGIGAKTLERIRPHLIPLEQDAAGP
jgi:competence protein ComEA